MKRLATLTLAAAITAATMFSPTAVEAKTGAASTGDDQVRYAWVKACPKSDYGSPCGPWNLTLRNGKVRALPDARIYPITAKGKVDKYLFAAFAISGDGRSVGYIRKSDGKLVVLDLRTNKVQPLPGKAATLPKGVGMDDFEMLLSANGDLLLIDYLDHGEKLPSLIVNRKTGTIKELNGKLAANGFSPDGHHLLLTRDTEDNTTEYLVYDDDGIKTASQVVPQVVASNGPIALANDARTLAVLIWDDLGKRRLRTYDIVTESIGDAVKVKVSRSGTPFPLLGWNEDGTLALWTYTQDVSTQVRLYSIDPDSGTATKADSFKINSAYTWRLPGE